MPPKTQLLQEEVDEIVGSINRVNALRTRSKKFKIGQGRIRRIWGEAGVKYREAYNTRKKVGLILTDSLMEEMMSIAQRLDGIKPWPANLDKVNGLPSALSDEQQLERYIASLRIANEASLAPGATKPTADGYYNAIMINAFELLPKHIYTRFADTIARERIHR